MKQKLNFELEVYENQITRENLSVNIGVSLIKDANSLCRAAQRGELEKVEHFINKGVYVNTRTKSGATPLYLAVENHHLNVVQFLVDRGADMNAKTLNEDTILHKAIGRVNLDITRLMINEGADLNIRNAKNETPLHSTSKWGYVLLVKILLESGSDPEVKNNNGVKPMHIAITHGFTDVARLLIEYGADISNASALLELYTGDPGLGIIVRKLLTQTDIVDSLCKTAINEQDNDSLQIKSKNDLVGKAGLLTDLDEVTQSTFANRILYKLLRNKSMTASEMIQDTDQMIGVLNNNINNIGSHLYFLVKELNKVYNYLKCASLENEEGGVSSLFKKTTELIKKLNLWNKVIEELPYDIVDKTEALEKLEKFFIAAHITLVFEDSLKVGQEMLMLGGQVDNGLRGMYNSDNSL